MNPTAPSEFCDPAAPVLKAAPREPLPVMLHKIGHVPRPPSSIYSVGEGDESNPIPESAFLEAFSEKPSARNGRTPHS